MRWLIAAFFLIPLAELYLLLVLGRQIGFWPTVALTMLTAMVGAALAKREGLRVWRSWRSAMDQMRPPELGIIEGLLVLVGATLLVTPGIMTDITGIALLFGPTRRWLAPRIRDRVMRRFMAGGGTFHVVDFKYPQPGSRPSREQLGHERREVIDTTGRSDT